MIKNIDLNCFKQQDILHDQSFLVSIKNFDLQSIRARYIASRKNSSGKIGSVERRKIGDGGIAKFTINEQGVAQHEVLFKCKEPRAIAVFKDIWAYAAENEVVIMEGSQKTVLKNDWFSYIHTLDFCPSNPDEILISSSGLDCFFIYNWKSKTLLKEWFAWENGLNKAWDKENNQEIILTRNKQEYHQLQVQNIAAKYITNPLQQNLPTAQRAAFINSVYYHPDDANLVYITLFHKGEVREVNLKDQSQKTIFEGLKSPHGGKFYQNAYTVTNTAEGEIWLKSGGQKTIYSFNNLPGKIDALKDLEWIQNSIFINEHVILAIDSNRTSFVLFDIEKAHIQLISYDNNWAVQDVMALEY